MIIIYQIGRLDLNAFSELEFEIDGKIFKSSLSSFALRDFLISKGYKVEVVLLYPISLPFNSSLINDRFKCVCDEDCYRQLEHALNKPEEYLKNPSVFFDSHPHSRGVKYIILHSLGKYKTLSDSVDFDCHYSDIVLMILTDMLKMYLSDEDNIEEIIIDISSGHNIYVSALIEAFRYLGTWIKLYKWSERIPSLIIAFSDPVIPGIARYGIHIEKQSIKVFFSSPIGKEDIDNYKLAGTIYSEEKSKKRNLQSLLESFALTFSAIKNNAPLAIYTFGYDRLEEIVKTLKDLIDEITYKLTSDYNKSPKLNKSDYLKVILSCAFYFGICKILSNKEIITGNAEINELRKRFGEIYKVFDLDLNDVIIGNEIDKIKNSVKEDREWTPLLELLYPTGKETNPQKRNFFAHAGLEGCITECNKEGSSIFLRYKEKKKDLIKRWLKEAI